MAQDINEARVVEWREETNPVDSLEAIPHHIRDVRIEMNRKYHDYVVELFDEPPDDATDLFELLEALSTMRSHEHNPSGSVPRVDGSRGVQAL